VSRQQKQFEQMTRKAEELAQQLSAAKNRLTALRDGMGAALVDGADLDDLTADIAQQERSIAALDAAHNEARRRADDAANAMAALARKNALEAIEQLEEGVRQHISQAAATVAELQPIIDDLDALNERMSDAAEPLRASYNDRVKINHRLQAWRIKTNKLRATVAEYANGA